MGLSAKVFRNKRNLQLGSDQELALVDRDTGQVYFEDITVERKYATARIAASQHLGNISMIAFLRDEVTSILGYECFLFRRVLYSGSHSGDFIPVSELDVLSTEISLIRDKATPSEELAVFFSSLESLVQCAHAEDNPVVFT